MLPGVRLNLFYLFLLCHCALLGQAGSYCSFDEQITGIYKDIIRLDFEKAESALRAIDKKSDNKAWILLENQFDFYKIFMLERSEDFKKLKPNYNKRQKELKRSQLPDNWESLIQAEIDLHWSLLHFKHQENIKGLRLLLSAKQLLESKKEVYPDFPYFDKSLGILHALLGAVPPEYLWALRLVGLDGNINQGIRELNSFIRFSELKDPYFLEESYAALSFILAQLKNEPEMAYKYWMSRQNINEPGPIHIWVQAKLAFLANYNDAALHALHSLPVKQLNKLPYLYYLKGLAEIQKLDPRAEHSFSNFLSLQKGEAHVKECWQKKAWQALMQNNSAGYHLAMSNCLIKGNTDTDQDEQAYIDARSGVKPDITLLKARLLCDGGYGAAALEVLKTKSVDDYSNQDHFLEYHYRLGRIFQLLNRKADALQSFKEVLTISGLKSSNYMACNAVLQSGLIYEQGSEHEKAKKAFATVLEMNPDRYRKSLHQKAKAGITRLTAN